MTEQETTYAIWLTAGILGFIALMFIVAPIIARRLLSGGGRQQALLESGARARAVISQVEQTGVFINQQPKCRIRFVVEPEGRPPYEAECQRVVLLTELAQLQPGTAVTVAFDPQEPSEVALVSIGDDTASSLSRAEAERMLDDQQALYGRLSKNGHRATAIVTASQDLGVVVNGVNPLVRLSIKVLPQGQPPYDGTVLGVFDPSALHKYEPGKTVNVLIDPAAPSIIALDGAVESTGDGAR